MADFTWVPDFGSSKKMQPRVRVAQFGDGYQQRQAWGINNNPSMWSLTFATRENAEADAIEAFLLARAGVEAFDFTPPYEATAKKFVCSAWDRTPEKATRSTITCEFVEVYEPS